MSGRPSSALGWITVISVVIAVATYILSLVIGGAIISTGQLAPQLQRTSVPLLLWAFMLGFYGPTVNVALIIDVSLIIFAICFMKAGSSNGGFLNGLRALLSGGRPKTLPNWLTVMPLLASGLAVITLLLGLLQDLFGLGTGMLNTNDPTVLLPSLALAPIAEELGFRITVMGLVTGILVTIKMGRNRSQGSTMSTSRELVTFFSAFVSPGYAKEQVGLPSVRTAGRKGIAKSEWFFLILTSLVFGLYHIVGGAGWGPGKFLTAALSGFVLGTVFLSYGAFANILLHWFFDMYFTVYVFYTAFSGAFLTFGDLSSLGALALGVWSIILGIDWLWKRNVPPMIPSSLQMHLRQ